MAHSDFHFRYSFYQRHRRGWRLVLLVVLALVALAWWTTEAPARSCRDHDDRCRQERLNERAHERAQERAEERSDAQDEFYEEQRRRENERARAAYDDAFEEIGDGE